MSCVCEPCGQASWQEYDSAGVGWIPAAFALHSRAVCGSCLQTMRDFTLLHTMHGRLLDLQVCKNVCKRTEKYQPVQLTVLGCVAGVLCAEFESCGARKVPARERHQTVLKDDNIPGNRKKPIQDIYRTHPRYLWEEDAGRSSLEQLMCGT